jgi:hypothetical protein
MREAVTARHTRITVPEVYDIMFSSSNTPAGVLEQLRNLMCSDGVHLTEEGYRMWVEAWISLINKTNTNNDTQLQKKTFFWRGFVSPHGGLRPVNAGAVHFNRPIRGGNRGGGKWPVSRGRGRGRGWQKPYTRK